MKKKTKFILIILLFVLLFACSKVFASDTPHNFINTTVARYYGSGANAAWQGSPNPNQVDSNIGLGFYCLNRWMHFTPYAINTQKTITINENGIINKTGTGTSRTDATNSQLYQLSYIFGHPEQNITARQYAVWSVKGTPGSDTSNWTTSEGKELYRNACAYENYINSGAKVSIVSENLVYNNGYIGPIYITYNTGKYQDNKGNTATYKPTLKDILVKGTNGTYYSKNDRLFTINNGKAEAITLNNIKSGEPFYIAMDSNSLTEYAIQLKYEDVYKGWLAMCDSTKNGSNQAVLAGFFRLYEKTIDKQEMVNTININLNKVDNNENIISDQTKFTVIAKQNGKEILNKEYVVNGNTTISITPSINATSPTNSDPVYVTIIETEAPNGYNKLTNPINIVYVCNVDKYWNAMYRPGYVSVDEIYKGFVGIDKDEKLSVEATSRLINFIKDEDAALYMMKYYALNNSDINENSFTNGNWLKNIEPNKDISKIMNEFIASLTNDKIAEFAEKYTQSGRSAYSCSGLKDFQNKLKTNEKLKASKEQFDSTIQGILSNYETTQQESAQQVFRSVFGDYFGAWQYRGYASTPYPHIYESSNNKEESDPKDKFKVEKVEANNNNLTQYSIYVYNTPNLPEITLNLSKVNYSGHLIDGAEFKLTAMQDGKEVQVLEKDKNIYGITPISRAKIYLKIEEVKAPKGYKEIEPICGLYYFEDDTWKANYGVKASDWVESGFEESIDYLEEFNKLGDNTLDYEMWLGTILKNYNKWNGRQIYSNKLWPQLYNSEENQDQIVINAQVDNDNNAVTDIEIYDKALIEEIQLIKVDKQGNGLSNARFKVKVTNIEGISEKYESTWITDANGMKGISKLVLASQTREVVLTIEEIGAPSAEYQLLSGPITIKIAHNEDGTVTVTDCNYDGEENVTAVANEGIVTITVPNEYVVNNVDIKGKVWLDGQVGIKDVRKPNGRIDNNEGGLEGIVVELINSEGNVVEGKTGITNKNGEYEIKDVIPGSYKVRFKYDGINYEDTEYGYDSKAFETDNNREGFNSNFETITTEEIANGISTKSNNGTELKYSYVKNNNNDNNKAILITKNSNGTVKDEFIMISETEMSTFTDSVDNLNFGLIRRGTDLAISTIETNAKVTINGKEGIYTYDNQEKSLTLGNNQESGEGVTYNKLELFSSDYYYRIRDQIKNNDKFTENNWMDPVTEGIKSGDELRVYVTYKVYFENQSAENVSINKIAYNYDEKYVYDKELTWLYNYDAADTAGKNIQINDDTINHKLMIDCDKMELTDSNTKSMYVVFEVAKPNNEVSLGDFHNTVEIISYSSKKGLIDCDSQPGNLRQNGFEDDSKQSPGITIKVKDEARKISGHVVDDESKKVNDVIVQLIELVQYDNKEYEYIWEETITGSGTGKRLNNTGDMLETYTYGKKDGEYQFIGYIPGNYIVRFIYGDGTTYDLTPNTIKYNGQDYKSIVDANYKEQYYDASKYSEGDSKARDNEARRLETMAETVLVDKEKGMLLKLLDVQDVSKLNITEKETLVEIYNNLHKENKITELTNETLLTLLKDETLSKTWMCAETSRLPIAVKSDETHKQYVGYSNINLGLEKRAETKISLEKNILSFRLIASNGTELVNATRKNSNSKIEGLKDNMQIVNEYWVYEVDPNEFNATVDGAKLEFTYDYVVKNEGELDYLSDTLISDYNKYDAQNYRGKLLGYSREIKTGMRTVTEIYKNVLGTYLGDAYYKGGTGTKVKTQVLNIKDYIDDDLSFKNGNNVAVGNTEPETHRVLTDTLSPTKIVTVNTTLTANETNKMEPGGMYSDYLVTLGKDPLSSSSKDLMFNNYIAEVMAYSNAAGRRATNSSPANAETIDRACEPDEAKAERVQITAATGENKYTSYILIASIIAGIAVVATGAFVTKKYIIK